MSFEAKKADMDSLPTPVSKRHQSTDINDKAEKSPKYFLPLKSERNPSRRNSIEEIATPNSRQILDKQTRRSNHKNTALSSSANKRANDKRSPYQVKLPIFKTEENIHFEKGFNFQNISKSMRLEKINHLRHLQIETEALDRSQSNSKAISPHSCQNNQSEKVFTPYSAKAHRSRNAQLTQDDKGSLFKKYYKNNMANLKKEKESFWERSKAKSLLDDFTPSLPNTFSYSKHLFNSKSSKHQSFSEKKECATSCKQSVQSISKNGSRIQVPSISLSGIMVANDGSQGETRTPVRSRGEIDSRSMFKLPRGNPEC